jgi:hypothetical protein
VKKMGKVYRSDAEKTELIKLELFMDSDSSDLGSKYSQYFSIIKDGDQRSGSSAKLFMSFREIESLIPLKKPAEKYQNDSDFVEGSRLVLFLPSS